MKLEFRVRYDTDVDRVRKIVKKINKEIHKDEELGPSLLDMIKSQGVREMDDSAMIMRVKSEAVPGEQFVLRREVYRRLQEAFQKNGIEFAHRNVTVYLPPESTSSASGSPNKDTAAEGIPDRKTCKGCCVRGHRRDRDRGNTRRYQEGLLTENRETCLSLPSFVI
ncbi:MAG: mechanosensitive ion channel family protein [Deltaproteobacteria bacterium]|nr:MAG: mechanosensitive ion channel family protein [Deltaproteobacteria bacterium]